MTIGAGYAITETRKRDSAVEAFAGLIERARTYDAACDLETRYPNT